MRKIVSRLILVVATTLIIGARANAEPIADFYHGKTISIYVGFPPGGGYDIYARVIAPYLTKHIPGNPVVLIKNMDGGVGVRAASFISNATPQDGTSLGMFLDGLTLSKVMGGPGAFDPMKMGWVGRIVSTATYTLVWHTSAAQSVEEAKLHQTTVGATSVSSSSSYVPLALNDLTGSKFKIVRGYAGAAPISLAMERGEVDVHGGIALEAIMAGRQDWLTEKKAKFLYYLGAERSEAQPNVPGLLDFAHDDRSRRILGLLGGSVDIGRSLVAEPGIPEERLVALRVAFMQTMADPELVAKMKELNLTLEPLPGEKLQKIIAGAVSTPKDLVEQTKKYFNP